MKSTFLFVFGKLEHITTTWTQRFTITYLVHFIKQMECEGMNTRIGHKFLNTQYKNCSRYINPWKTNQYHQRDQHGIRGIKRKKKNQEHVWQKIHGPKISGNFKTSIYNLTLIQWCINIKFMKIHNYTS